MAFTGSYATPAEFKELAPEFDLTGIDDAALLVRLTRASRLVEHITHDQFTVQQYLGEMEEWRMSHRFYARHWPVVSIQSAYFQLGAGITASIDIDAILINNTQRYMEVAALALAMTFTTDLLALGLVEPLLVFNYTAGYADIPDGVKIATMLAVGAQIASMRMVEDGFAGLHSFTVGSYTVSLARGTQGARGTEESAGFANYMPPEALEFLHQFMFTSVR